VFVLCGGVSPVFEFFGSINRINWKMTIWDGNDHWTILYGWTVICSKADYVMKEMCFNAP